MYMTFADVVWNPLGVLSRMNVGQVLEVHLGWAAKGLGWRIGEMLQRQAKIEELREFLTKIYNESGRKEELDKASPTMKLSNWRRTCAKAYRSPRRVFDGATEEEMSRALSGISDDIAVAEPGMTPSKNQVRLYTAARRDVRTYGDACRLHALPEAAPPGRRQDARVPRAYLLVTQQPLGGKAQFGGQRFGEMEVWALEAYGASYVLQEMLTVKSDDVTGRTKVYENLVKGDHVIDAGMPESFNVLVKEIRSLGIDIDLDRN